MTIPAVPTPYVTPEMLTTAPTGIDWTSIPPGRLVSQASKDAELFNIAVRASSDADGLTNQVLRATIDTETVYGPDFYVTQEPSGAWRMVTSRFPVLNVMSMQTSPAAVFPRQWSVLPSGSFYPAAPTIGIYGSSAPSGTGSGGQNIYFAPGYMSWALGRRGYAVQATYVNGWPHTVLTADATSGASTLTVADATGWAPFSGSSLGAIGVLFDGQNQEQATVVSSTSTYGPATLTLSTALSYGHSAQTLFSTIPGDAQWAVILLATAQALTRGATSTTVQAIPGGSQGATGGIDDLRTQAYRLLAPFRRTI
jgi:hypothetical protein